MKNPRSMLLFLILCFSLTAFCQLNEERIIGLVWDPNPPWENVTKYTIYHSKKTGGPWVAVVSVAGNITNTSVPYYGGRNYWMATASNDAGESDPSSEVMLFFKPSTVNSIRTNSIINR